MKAYGKHLHKKVDKLLRETSYWAQIITYSTEGLLLAEIDPCSSYRMDDAAMAYKLYGLEGLPDGFHFIPVSWIETIQDEESADRALQMRTFGKVRYE